MVKIASDNIWQNWTYTMASCAINTFHTHLCDTELNGLMSRFDLWLLRLIHKTNPVTMQPDKTNKHRNHLPVIFTNIGENVWTNTLINFLSSFGLQVFHRPTLHQSMFGWSIKQLNNWPIKNTSAPGLQQTCLATVKYNDKSKWKWKDTKVKSWYSQLDTELKVEG